MIYRTKANRNFACCIAIATTLLLPSLARAQESDSDLRKQNQQLAAQVQELQRDLRQAQSRNKELDEKVKLLEEQLAAARRAAASPGRTQTPPLEPETITIDETVANASPRALLNALVASYQKSVEGLEMGNSNDAKRRGYLRKLENWRAGAAREFRSQIEWQVRIVDAADDRGNHRELTLVAVDPKSDVRLGEPFVVTLSRQQVDRLSRYQSHSDLDTLVLRGTLIPDVRINEARDERGSFDHPRFIGPFAEFEFRIDVISLQPTAEKDKPKEKDLPPGATTKPATMPVAPAPIPPSGSAPEKP